jgi:hypothetical protein
MLIREKMQMALTNQIQGTQLHGRPSAFYHLKDLLCLCTIAKDDYYYQLSYISSFQKQTHFENEDFCFPFDSSRQRRQRLCLAAAGTASSPHGYSIGFW